MEQINNEKFGRFLLELRSEKGMTQRELGKKLYVSDKTVSKWERGASLPQTALIIPLAETLGVTAQELLTGEKITGSNQTGPDSKTGNEAIHEELCAAKKKRILFFAAALLITLAEIGILYGMGISIEDMRQNVILFSLLFLLFSGWFCIGAKELLPAFYDQEKISFVQQGPVRINLAGIGFNNNNWPRLCRFFRIWCAAAAVFYPLVCIITVLTAGFSAWETFMNSLALILALILLVGVLVVAKKNE